MKLAEKIVDEVCRGFNGLCVIGGHMDLTELVTNIDKILIKEKQRVKKWRAKMKSKK